MSRQLYQHGRADRLTLYGKPATAGPPQPLPAPAGLTRAEVDRVIADLLRYRETLPA